LVSFFTEFRKGKFKYTSKLAEKSKVSRLEELRKIWDTLPDESFSVMEQIASELKILGKIKSTFPDLDRKYAFVIGLDTKYSPKVKLQGLNTGKISDVRIQKKVFENNPFVENQIILCGEFEKKFGGRYDEDKNWIENKEVTIWWLKNYNLLKGDLR
jgi:hypothetical protein